MITLMFKFIIGTRTCMKIITMKLFHMCIMKRTGSKEIRLLPDMRNISMTFTRARVEAETK